MLISLPTDFGRVLPHDSMATRAGGHVNVSQIPTGRSAKQTPVGRGYRLVAGGGVL